MRLTKDYFSCGIPPVNAFLTGRIGPAKRGNVMNIRKTLRALAITAIPAALAVTATSAAATPAPAPTPANDPCTATWIVGAMACQGYYDKNWLTGTTGSATTAEELAAINLLLTGTASTSDTLPTDNTGAYNPPYALDYDTVLGSISGLNGSATLNFGSLNLTGLTIVGAHFGNTLDSNQPNVTAFWLIDLGNLSTNTLTLTNGQGSSNAQIFSTGGDTRLPEPGTWAMMLVGFGAAGVAMRRSRRRKALLTQLA
jgi:hypothetical protein